MSDSPHKAIQFLIDTSPLYAKAKADRMFLEEFRKSRKAQLASQAGTEVLGKQDLPLLMPTLNTSKSLKESGKPWRRKSVFVGL